MKKCFKCGAEVADNAKFCAECGFNMKEYEEKNRVCPSCGAQLSGGKFCSECGAPIGGNAFSSNDEFFEEMEKLSAQAVAEQESERARERLEKLLSPFEVTKHADGTYSILKLKDAAAMKIAVPEGVVSIEKEAFANCQAIEISLPEGLLSIGERAFFSCENLMKIGFPASLVIVGDHAFQNCSMLEAQLPQSVKKVGEGVLDGTLADLRRQEQVRAARQKRLDEAGVKVHGDYVEFGMWMQGNSNDNPPGLALDKPDENGYFTDQNGKKWAKDWKKSNYSGSVPTYYEVLPIRWRIVAERGGRKLLLSEDILDYRDWGQYKPTYEESDIRKWLNGEFFAKAFTEKQRELVCTVNVDNSAASTGNENNAYACGTTQDKVFLLSLKEFQEIFGGNAAHKRMSMFLFARFPEYKNREGMYSMLRSRADANNYLCFGFSSYGSKYFGDCGIVPAIEIEL